eukprot:218003-Prymnesium_polylepis.1
MRHAATRCAALRSAQATPRRPWEGPSNPPAPSLRPDMHGATPSPLLRAIPRCVKDERCARVADGVLKNTIVYHMISHA